MANKENVYADGIVNLAVINGLVRIDLGTVDTYVDGGERKQRTDVTHCIVMPLNNFVRAVGVQQRLLSQLSDRAKQAAAEATKHSDATPPVSVDGQG